MSDITAARSPHGRVCDALDKLEGQYPPWIFQPGYVKEAKHISSQTQAQYLKPRIYDCIEKHEMRLEKVSKYHVTYSIATYD